MYTMVRTGTGCCIGRDEVARTGGGTRHQYRVPVVVLGITSPVVMIYIVPHL
jgi:hypothetical protein